MKRKKIPVLLLTAVCCLAMLPTAAVATTAAEPATQTETTLSDTELVDSGFPMWKQWKQLQIREQAIRQQTGILVHRGIHPFMIKMAVSY